MEQVVELLQARAVGPVTWGELAGDVTGVACVWLVARQHILNWPMGLLNNALFFLLFWSAKLYADATLQGVFAVLALYGWWTWARGDARRAAALPVRRTRRGEWAWLVPATLGGALGLGAWLARVTDSPVPYWDAAVTALSLAATYGQARKLLESWWVWIAVDLLSIPLYAVRGLYPTAVLYAVFLVLCVVGLRSWSRELAPADVPSGAEPA